MRVLQTVAHDDPGETRGRPRIRQDDEILVTALEAFAALGYEAMSLRSLNAQLGLSHGTISQRFGSKERLYFAAVDLGFNRLLDDIARRRHDLLAVSDPPDDLADLRATVRAFLGASLARPELGRLMHQEGLEPSARLAYIVDSYLLPMMATIGALLRRLRAAGRIRPVTARGLFFLVGHGAGAPFMLTALSDVFDAIDGPLDPERHADDMTDLIIRGVTLADADAPDGATAALRQLAGPEPSLDILHPR
jgi:AcrR family transcriptional regulator